MKLKKIAQGLCAISSMIILTACGENFSAGVSLGGSGSGLGKPNENGGPNIGGADEDSNKDHHNYRLHVPKTTSDHCQGLEREFSFAYKDGDKPLVANEPVNIGDAKLIVTVYNNTAQSIFERTISCTPLVVFHRTAIDAHDENAIALDESLTCPNHAAIQVWQPFEKRVYEMNFDFIHQAGFYTLNYNNSIASSWAAPVENWTKCEALSSQFQVDAVQQSNQIKDEIKDEGMVNQVVPHVADDMFKPTVMIQPKTHEERSQ